MKRYGILALAALTALLLVVLVRLPVAAPTDAAATHSADPADEGFGVVRERDPVPWEGVDWQRTADPFGRVRDPLLRIDGATAVPGGILAWGRVPMPGRNQFNDMAAVFVTRDDGRSWRAVPIDHGVRAADASELLGVAVGPLGYLAYGGVCCESEGRALWHSVDAVEWMRLQMGGEIDPSAMHVSAVAGTDRGWVAVANAGDGSRGEIWFSADGADWRSVLTQENGLPGATITDVAVAGDEILAVGTVTGADGTYDGAVWRSSDGEAWERLGADDPALAGAGETQLSAVVPYVGGVFITGMHGSTEDRRKCEQLGMAAPVALGPPGAALSCGWGTEHQFVMDLDGTWRRVAPGGRGGEHPIEFRNVAAGGPGLVLLGESSAPASPDTNLFTSPDGVEWTLVAPRLPLGGGVANALVVRDRTLVAIGDHVEGQESVIDVWLGFVR